MALPKKPRLMTIRVALLCLYVFGGLCDESPNMTNIEQDLMSNVTESEWMNTYDVVSVTTDANITEAGTVTGVPEVIDDQADDFGSKVIPGYVTVPLLLIIGLFGNAMSIVVMTRREFKNMVMSIIIVALALSDTLLIIMQPHNKPYVRQLIATDVRSYNIESCKIFYWFYRTAKMTSSWFIVLISMERFVAVWFPLKAKLINTRRNISLAVCLVYLGIGGFNAAWGTIADVIMGGSCIPNKAMPELADVAKAFVIAGTLIYSIIPSCIILTVNTFIVAKLALAMRQRTGITSTADNSRRQEQHSTMTAMLLGVSFSFIVLVIPVSIMHSLATFSGFNPFVSMDPTIVIVREVITTLEQINYSINFYLYVLCSRAFRQAVVRLLVCAPEDRGRPGLKSSATRSSNMSRDSSYKERKTPDAISQTPREPVPETKVHDVTVDEMELDQTA